jgi:hypothetical protein
MLNETLSPSALARGHRVRELVCAYRPLRDHNGRIVDVPTVVLTDPRTAAAVLAPLIADQPVEVFGVACLSTRNRFLAWHVLSRGTRASTPISMPDVFVPACLTRSTNLASKSISSRLTLTSARPYTPVSENASAILTALPS